MLKKKSCSSLASYIQFRGILMLVSLKKKQQEVYSAITYQGWPFTVKLLLKKENSITPSVPHPLPSPKYLFLWLSSLIVVLTKQCSFKRKMDQKPSNLLCPSGKFYPPMLFFALESNPVLMQLGIISQDGQFLNVWFYSCALLPSYQSWY